MVLHGSCRFRNKKIRKVKSIKNRMVVATMQFLSIYPIIISILLIKLKPTHSVKSQNNYFKMIKEDNYKKIKELRFLSP